ncbi:hypothetical protein BPOR_0011g00270 [Botrytis porri]|uniref:Uncharacterized protein n=1 Tax=Botrytis porri TaxID=87229 RepID=A0A4Z1L5X5_9HELO|nr:hypothetical protein BPOR_0011g00270 [Botrytis porri]
MDAITEITTSSNSCSSSAAIRRRLWLPFVMQPGNPERPENLAVPLVVIFEEPNGHAMKPLSYKCRSYASDHPIRHGLALFERGVCQKLRRL